MKFRTTLRDSPEINLTALIDVVFLLLIFFMVSTTFEWRSELSIELPAASAREIPRDDAIIEVAVDADGNVQVDGRRLDGSEVRTLRRALAAAARGLDSPRVTVSADARTPHQSVVTVMDAARQAGLYRLTFAARLSEEAAR
ncbi:MAG: biopolymer transporter ExbD [Thiotrichales bacterium]|nr:biopolymer transporter ExbD [Thiotrichales bacterium]